jgi:hypothetical protein
MSPEMKACREQALKLPPSERALLAAQLIASLDDLDDAENEKLWIEEAEKRYQAYTRGQLSARAAEDVLLDARKRIR